MGHKEISFQILIGEKPVQVKFSKESLAADAIREATIQGADLEIVSEIAEEMGIEIVEKNEDYLGMWSWHEKEKKFYLHPRNASKILVAGGHSRLTKFGDKLPQEYWARAYEQILNQTWRHERQHLIQEATPAINKYKFVKDAERVIGYLMSANLIINYLYLAVTLLDNNLNTEVKDVVFNQTIALMFFTAGAAILVRDWDILHSPWEKEADKVVKTEMREDGPIRVEDML